MLLINEKGLRLWRVEYSGMDPERNFRRNGSAHVVAATIAEALSLAEQCVGNGLAEVRVHSVRTETNIGHLILVRRGDRCGQDGGALMDTKPCHLCGGTQPADNKTMLGIESKPPRSPVEFRLSVGAESKERLAIRLDEIVSQLRGEHWDGPLSPRRMWGGAGSHGHYELDEDASITPEAYNAALLEWRKAQPRTPPADGTCE